jgi:hypothetical protein
MDRKKWYGTLIIVSPLKPQPFKFRLPSAALAIFAVATMVTFLMIAAVRDSLHALRADHDRVRLVDENQQLKVGNKNAVIGGLLLSDRVARIEERARQIEELLEEKPVVDTPDEPVTDSAQ